MPDLDPADLSLKGQRLQAIVVRTAESWQFFAFVFAAVLALAYAVMNDLLEGANWHWRWKLVLRIGLFVASWYVFMRDRWVRKQLVRFMGWTKRESELLP